MNKFCIKGKLLLAPMSNVTNLPFRILCKKYGASLVYSEMINADAYIMDSRKTLKRAYFLEEERPIGIQITGSNEKILVKAVKKVESKLKPNLIDINIGCPAYNVMKTGSGAALLKNPSKLGRLVKLLSQATKLPLTCKIRIATSSQKTLFIARLLEQSGVSVLTVHGRTPEQGYSGRANWEIIKQIKEKAKIPVVLNGDVVDEISAGMAFKQTNCDAVMIGRAAIGNPYLFKRINHYLSTNTFLTKQSLKDKIKDFLEYLKLCQKFEFLDISTIKIQAQYFIKGFPGNNKIRNKITQCKAITDIKELMISLY